MTRYRWLLALVTMIFVAFTVGACSPPMTAGTIVEKKYDDPDTWTSQEPVYAQECKPVTRTRTTYTNGKSSTSTYTTTECTSKITHYRTVSHYDGPHWRLKLKDGKRTGWVDVDQTTYDRANVGRAYPLEPEQTPDT